MISHDNLKELSAEWGLREDIVEKDYVIGWLLRGIGNHERLIKDWVFKGGTCLKKCFIETWRFSEDLDFTVLPEGLIEPDDLKEIIPVILERIHDESGIDFSAQEPMFKVRGPGSIEGRIYYRGPRNAPQAARVKLDLLNTEKVVCEPVLRDISNPFEEYEGPFPPRAQVQCYSIEEIFAEKIRAMGERCRPRDLYDIINLHRNNRSIGVEATSLRDVHKRKCESKGVPITTLALIQGSQYREEIVSEWANMLGHQLPVLPAFEQFWEELPQLFAWFEREETVILEPIRTGPREVRTSWVPPRNISHWGIGIPLETVRFAAFNHLCVDLSYLKGGHELKQYRIEPYSLYRTQDENLIIRAVRADIGEPRSFRVDRIRSISATDVSFRPRYSIEMFEHGPDLSQASSSRNYSSPRGRVRATPKPRRVSSFGGSRQSGTKYVYECTHCGKKFTHSSQNSQLRKHKDKTGWDCSGRSGYLVDTKYGY